MNFKLKITLLTFHRIDPGSSLVERLRQTTLALKVLGSILHRCLIELGAEAYYVSWLAHPWHTWPKIDFKKVKKGCWSDEKHKIKHKIQTNHSNFFPDFKINEIFNQVICTYLKNGTTKAENSTCKWSLFRFWNRPHVLLVSPRTKWD